MASLALEGPRDSRRSKLGSHVDSKVDIAEPYPAGDRVTFFVRTCALQRGAADRCWPPQLSPPYRDTATRAITAIPKRRPGESEAAASSPMRSRVASTTWRLLLGNALARSEPNHHRSRWANPQPPPRGALTGICIGNAGRAHRGLGALPTALTRSPRAAA